MSWICVSLIHFYGNSRGCKKILICGKLETINRWYIHVPIDIDQGHEPSPSCDVVGSISGVRQKLRDEALIKYFLLSQHLMANPLTRLCPPFGPAESALNCNANLPDTGSCDSKRPAEKLTFVEVHFPFSATADNQVSSVWSAPGDSCSDTNCLLILSGSRSVWWQTAALECRQW